MVDAASGGLRTSLPDVRATLAELRGVQPDGLSERRRLGAWWTSVHRLGRARAATGPALRQDLAAREHGWRRRRRPGHRPGRCREGRTRCRPSPGEGRSRPLRRCRAGPELRGATGADRSGAASSAIVACRRRAQSGQSGSAGVARWASYDASVRCATARAASRQEREVDVPHLAVAGEERAAGSRVEVGHAARRRPRPQREGDVGDRVARAGVVEVDERRPAVSLSPSTTRLSGSGSPWT